MANTTFTNTHMHIFTEKCVSKNFLRVIPQKIVRKFAPQILLMLNTSFGRTTIKLLAKVGRNKDGKKRTMTDKTISFLSIALQNTQANVLEIELETARTYDPSARAVALTMNMDYMDDIKPEMDFETQLQDVKDIKSHNARAFMPFLGVDPRHRSGTAAVDWAKKFFEIGVTDGNTVLPYFSGIKLYPALGFFPFDPALYELYDYAQKNNIPVMTHCTRVGNQYIGTNIEGLIPKNIGSLLLNPSNNSVIQDCQKNIQARVNKYYELNWIKNNKTGANDFACDLFGHPENYILLFETFPDLKICLAHMGGGNEIYCEKPEDDLKKIWAVDSPTWFERIRNMMITYPNMYTDISYVLSDLDVNETYKRMIAFFETLDNSNKPLYQRVLFGTDFFMTEQEKREKELYALAKEKLAKYWNDITVINPAKYIGM